MKRSRGKKDKLRARCKETSACEEIHKRLPQTSYDNSMSKSLVKPEVKEVADQVGIELFVRDYQQKIIKMYATHYLQFKKKCAQTGVCVGSEYVGMGTCQA